MRLIFTLIVLAGALVGHGIDRAFAQDFNWLTGIGTGFSIVFICYGYSALTLSVQEAKSREQSPSSTRE